MAPIRYARCASCRNFYMLDVLAKRACPSCVYSTYRCKDCDGADGADRSIKAHFNWYRGRGKGAGGHTLDRKGLL